MHEQFYRRRLRRKMERLANRRATTLGPLSLVWIPVAGDLQLHYQVATEYQLNTQVKLYGLMISDNLTALRYYLRSGNKRQLWRSERLLWEYWRCCTDAYGWSWRDIVFLLGIPVAIASGYLLLNAWVQSWPFVVASVAAIVLFAMTLFELIQRTVILWRLHGEIEHLSRLLKHACSILTLEAKPEVYTIVFPNPTRSSIST